MKQDFKNWIKLHKGKKIDQSMINMISQKHEDEIGNMLYNEGLCLESINTGKTIVFGSCEKDDMDWSVEQALEAPREFKTLRGAINFANQ